MLKKGISLLLVLAVFLLPACGKKDEVSKTLDSHNEVAQEMPREVEIIENTGVESTDAAQSETVAVTESAAEATEDTAVETEAPDTTEATTKPASEDSGVVDGNFFGDNQSASSETVVEVITPTPTESVVAPAAPTSDYERFINMAPADQQAYMESFSSVEAFFTWYNAEKEKYDAEHPPIEIDGSVIDLEKIING